MLSDSFLNPREHSGSSIFLDVPAERALLGWIPATHRLDAVQLNGFVLVSSSQLKRCCMFIISVRGPIDRSYPEAKDDLYRIYFDHYELCV